MAPRVAIVDRDLGWSKMFALLKEIESSRVNVGVLDEGAGAEKPEGADLTVAEIAAVLEFGTADGHIPARPFMRSTFDEQREKLVDLGKKLIVAVLDEKTTIAKALNVMGATLVDDVKRNITAGDGIPPPNAPATIEAKGSDRPLVDTGRMVGAITWSVKVGDK